MASVTAVPTFVFKWQIENFSRIGKRKCSLISPTFKAVNLNNSRWHVKVKEADNKYVYVSLQNESLGNACSPLFNWEYSFLDNNEATIFVACAQDHDFRKIPLYELSIGPTVEDILVTRRTEYLRKDTLTVKLLLWQSSEEKETTADYVEYCTTRTVIGLDRVCTIWDIERFSLLQVDQELTKPLYFINSGWLGTVSFFLVGNILRKSEVYVYFSEELNQLSMASGKISLLDIDKKTVKTMEDQYAFNKFPQQFLTRQEILSNATRYLKEDVLSLLWEFEVNVQRHVGTTYYRPANLRSIPGLFSHNVSIECNRPSQNDSSSPNLKKNKVTNKMEDVYPNCDFELRSGASSFPVHKLVLSAQSPVFKNMFYSNTETVQSNFPSIKDMDLQTLTNMLDFLYGNAIGPQGLESAVSLYNAAVEYQVQSLKEHCHLILMSLTSVSNVCDILLLADKNGDEKLKSSVHAFFNVNWGAIITSEAWNEFRKQNLTLAVKTFGRAIHTMLEEMEKKQLTSLPRAKNSKRSRSLPSAKNSKQSSSLESEPPAKKD